MFGELGLGGVSAIAAMALTAGAAMAQDTTTLKVATFTATNHYGVQEGTLVFNREVEALSDGAVKVEFYPAEQAGKARQLLDLVKVGAIDVAELATAYVSNAELPLLGVLEIPGLDYDICDGTRAIRKIGDPGGVLYEGDFAPAGIRVISYYVYPAFGPAASRVKIGSVADLNGLKMRSAGGLMELAIGALGGVPMKLTSPEIPQALQRGTLDTVMMSFKTIENYGYDDFAPFAATGFSFGTPGIVAVMSESRYQSLPENVRAAIDEAGRRAEDNFCAYAASEETRAIKDLQESGRMTIHQWTDEDLGTLHAKLDSLTDGWVQQLEARGKPAEATLQAFTSELQSQ